MNMHAFFYRETPVSNQISGAVNLENTMNSDIFSTLGDTLFLRLHFVNFSQTAPQLLLNALALIWY